LLGRANSVFWTRALNIPCPISFVFPNQLPVPPALRALQLRNESTSQQLDESFSRTTQVNNATNHLESSSAIEGPLAKLSDDPTRQTCLHHVRENDSAGNKDTTHWYKIIAD